MKMGQQLALSQRNLIYNNLGGLGPGHLDDPAELRFGETAMRGERRVDVAARTLCFRRCASAPPIGSVQNGRLTTLSRPLMSRSSLQHRIPSF